MKNYFTFYLKTNTHAREKQQNLLSFVFKKSERDFNHGVHREHGEEYRHGDAEMGRHGEEKKMQMRLATDEHGLSQMKYKERRRGDTERGDAGGWKEEKMQNEDFRIAE